MTLRSPILVTGASSFVGAHVVAWLREHHPDVHVIAVRNNTPLGLQALAPQTELTVDLCAPEAAELLAEHKPAVVLHMACKVMPANGPELNSAMLETVLSLCKRTGATLLHGSTTQVSWSELNRYARGRLDEERRIASADVPHVILRPCAPYGPALSEHTPHHRESFHLLADLVRKYPALPIMGPGTQLRQPVHITDWCEVVGHFATREPAEMPQRAFDVGGPDALTFNSIVDQLGHTLGKRIRRVHVSRRLATLGAPLFKGLSRDAISTFCCDDSVDPLPLVQATGKTAWIPFSEGCHDLLGQGWTLWDDPKRRRGPRHVVAPKPQAAR